ncbi:MAG TPA: hypothetical protein VMZ26_17650, partial [Pyrinomonadaceae bacterium]|nr:hypothetical protein [Pyrinomonadaceae bacterium]
DVAGEDPMSDEARFQEESFGVAPATEDIDSLYHQSVAEPTGAEVESDAGTPRYVDAGMDDEMIETTSFAAEETAASPDSYYSENGGPAVREPVSEYAQIQEMQAPDTDAPFNYETDYSEPGSVQLQDSREAPTSEFQYPETNGGQQYSDEPASSVLNAGEIGAAVAGATADAFSEFDEFSRTEQMPAFEMPSTAGGAYFDEDLLDLPPIENGNTLEFSIKQPGGVESESKQVVSLSPELMEIIVQKVVEKLSDKN